EHMTPEVLGLLQNYFNESVVNYFSLEKVLPHLAGGQTPPDTLNLIHCGVRDLATLLQLIASFVEPVLSGPEKAQFFQFFTISEDFLQKILQIARFGCIYKPFALNFPSDSQLKRDEFLQVQVHVYSTIRNFCHWLLLFGSECAETFK